MLAGRVVIYLRAREKSTTAQASSRYAMFIHFGALMSTSYSGSVCTTRP